MVKRQTIATSDAPSAPLNAATLPPPGAGSAEAT